MVESGRKQGRQIGPDHCHEDMLRRLVANPEHELGSIADFLSLPYSPDMLAYHEGRARNDPGLSAKKAWLPPTGRATRLALSYEATRRGASRGLDWRTARRSRL
jgi:hypothetical protein